MPRLERTGFEIHGLHALVLVRAIKLSQGDGVFVSLGLQVNNTPLARMSNLRVINKHEVFDPKLFHDGTPPVIVFLSLADQRYT